MTLHVHRAERTDLLADELAGLLATPPTDPFTPDIVAVPTKGVERFLAQRLALTLGSAPGDGDGVCANVLFPAPGEVLDAAIGPSAQRDPDRDPWRPAELPWHVAEVMCGSLDQDWALPIRVFLRDDPSPAEALAVPLPTGPPRAGRSGGADTSTRADVPPVEPVDASRGQDAARDPWRGSGRVMALSRRLAELFRTYDLERPAMVTDWAAGTPAEVPEDLLWQFHLWSAMRERLGVPSLGEVLAEACATLAAEPDTVALPERISVFGPTRIPYAHLTVLRALGEQRDVHLWLPDPSPTRWLRITAAAADLDDARPLRRHLPLSADHPLLRSLGRDGAELAYQLGSLEGGTASEAAASPERPDTLLGWLQSDLAADRVASEAERAGRQLRADDTSLRIHACSGRPRQVDVLREALLGLLQRDPTLEPRDILVMCPDVAAFAPLVTAAFGVDDPRSDTPPAGSRRFGARVAAMTVGASPGRSAEGPPGAGSHRNPAQDLRVRIADRTREQLNPVLAALDALLELAVGRMRASEVFDFAALPVVSSRFGWNGEQLERLRTLADDAGVRWGLDWEDRRRFVMANGQNTWSAGLDRMFLGVAMAEDGATSVGRVLPLDDVSAQDVEAVGRLAELVDRLRGLVPPLREARTASHWQELLSLALTQLTDVPSWERGQFVAALGAIGRLLRPDGRESDVLLELGDIRQLLAGLLAGRPTRTNFRTGGLTVCSLVPMRSVPHRVVCLLGIDDGVYPRAGRVDGNDVLGREPRVGEPDAGTADRQVLLDAIMAATETLVIVHTGADPHTSASQPAAVPVQELIDAAALTATGPELAGGGSIGVRELIVVRHPLQPFDPSNFMPTDPSTAAATPGTGAAGEPFSHDEHALAGARALVRPQQPHPPFVPDRLEAEPPREVTLAELERFLTAPPAYYLRKHMGLSFSKDDDTPSDEMPVHLDPLQRYHVGERVLTALLEGGDPSRIWLAEALRGSVPPGNLGDLAATDIVPQAQRIAAYAQRWRQGTAREVGVDVTLPSGIRVTGLVGGVFETAVVRTTFAKIKEKYQLEAWVRLLALNTQTGADFQACVVAHAERGSRACGVELAAPEDPAAVLDQIVDLHLRGLREPLPLTPRSAYQYARCRPATSADEALAGIAWLWDPDPFHRTNDACEEANMAIWGTEDPFAQFTAATPEPDEQLWFPDEPTRFGVLARRLYSPMIPCRTTV